MNPKGDNGMKSYITVQQPEPAPLTPGSQPRSAEAQAPYVPEKKKQKSAWENIEALVLGAAIAIVLLILAWKGIPKAARKAGIASHQTQQSQTGPTTASPTASITPVLDAGHAPGPQADRSMVDPKQVHDTATRQTSQTVASNLSGVRPFDNQQSWQPTTYQPGMETQAADTAQETETKNEREQLEKASLVFVRSNSSSRANQTNLEAAPVDAGIGMAPGTKLRAHLESAISTAVRTPVVAVIEYNYERSGEIVVPAGAKALGHLESAERSGYVQLRFDSLMMPDGSMVSMEATATDLHLRPLKGKVEGKNTGKNILVRSLTGVGEVAATVVGRSSFNQPLSEADLLRERVSTNIGQAGDQEVTKLAITERLVVSVPASTEIYVVLEKTTKSSIGTGMTPASSNAISNQLSTHSPSIEELRQLLQLQRELNQGAAAPTAQN
jgi:hypothetical protein